MITSLTDTLIKAGFDHYVALIYVTLAEGGEMGVPILQQKTTLSRAAIYDGLNILMPQGYVLYRKTGRSAFYRAEHPNKLLALIGEKQRETALLADEMKNTIQTLVGSYNLANNKPGMRIYEGKDGIIEAYEDLLEIKQSIDSIEDKGEMATFIPDYFPKFIAKRVSLGLFNRVVAPSTNKINITSDKEKRHTKSIPVDIFPFSMDIKISGNTVLIVTLKGEGAIAVRIDDPIIAVNFKLIFKFFWDYASKLYSENNINQEPAEGSVPLTVFNT